MEKINIIKGYWNCSTFSQDYNERDMWEGQIILNEDGWFEGLVKDTNSPYKEDRLVFGVYFPNIFIELLKLAPSEVSDPFKFHAKRDAKGYEGKLSAIGLFGERAFGNCHIITQELENQNGLQELQTKINTHKSNLDETNKMFYTNTSGIRPSMIEIMKAKYKIKTLSDEDKANIDKQVKPFNEAVDTQTENHVLKLVKNINYNK